FRTFVSVEPSVTELCDAQERGAQGLTLILDDAEAERLVRAAQRYEDRAITRLYQLYADRILRYIFYRVGERGRAEELTGEVFVRFLENIGTFRLGAQGQTLALTGWIYRIAHNIVIDEYRRRKVRHDVEELPEDWEENYAVGPGMDVHLTRADLQLALRRLTDEQQTVILLRFEEGLESSEVAQIMGKTETAIKALQRRALATLARLLSPVQA
ncbi:MAG: RNA polymerase sigma factor, partial [Anaerolineae bacterium]